MGNRALTGCDTDSRFRFPALGSSDTAWRITRSRVMMSLVLGANKFILARPIRWRLESTKPYVDDCSLDPGRYT